MHSTFSLLPGDLRPQHNYRRWEMIKFLPKNTFWNSFAVMAQCDGSVSRDPSQIILLILCLCFHLLTRFSLLHGLFWVPWGYSDTTIRGHTCIHGVTHLDGCSCWGEERKRERERGVQDMSIYQSNTLLGSQMKRRTNLDCVDEEYIQHF